MSTPKDGTAPKRSTKMLEAQVGAFVVLLFVAGCGVILLLGRSQHIFAHQVTVQAFFDDVQGLKPGAPVRLSGVNVGTVASVRFVREGGEPKVRVTMHIEKHLFSDVRVDSVAHIDAQGLLGDKIIEINAGSTTAEEVQPGGTLQSAAPADLTKLMSEAGDVLAQVKKAATKAALAMDELADPKTIADVRIAVHSMRVLIHEAETGTGLAHQLFYDHHTAQEIDQLATQLNALSGNLNRGVSKIDAILAATDDKGDQLINNFSRAALAIGQVATQVRDSHVVPNLEKATASASVAMDKAGGVIDYIKSGQGSLGGVIMDPTAYEQLLTILGGVQRSRILRAVVRYAVSQGDKKASAKVPLELDDHMVKSAPANNR